MTTTGSLASSAQLPSFGVGNGLLPKNGTRTIPVTLQFSSQSSITVDLSLSEFMGEAEFIQTIYVDNSTGPRSVNITSQITGQILTWPAGSQGYLAVLATKPAKFICASTSAVDILVQFISAPMAAQIWASTLGGMGLDASGSAPALSANLLATLAVNGKRALVEAQNQSASQMQLVLDDGTGVTTPSIYLLSAATGANSPGGSWSDTTFKGRVRIFCGTAAQQVMLRET